MSLCFFAFVLFLPCVFSLPSRLTEEISQEAESVGISLWDFAKKDFDVLNILRKSAPRTGRTILDTYPKDIRLQEEESSKEMSDRNSAESRQRSAAKTIFEHFMMKGHQRYMYPLTVDYSHEQKEADVVLVH